MQKTIEEIHSSFDTAGDKLLAEAKAIVAAPMVNDTKTIARLQNLGFNTAKPIKDAEEMFKKQEHAKMLIEAIEYFQLHYPSYKFIEEAQIKDICGKYGLLYGDAENYIGDIPEKNLSEIEAFKLREEDYYKEESMFDMWQGMVFGSPRRRGSASRQNEMLRNNFWMSGFDPVDFQQSQQSAALQMQQKALSVDYGWGTPEKPKTTKPPFKICAPSTDFRTIGYVVSDGYKLVYDPIVIQPVKYKKIAGGLVVSKWGLEGQDESLVNEIMN